jgi:hypothetical protein
LLRKWHFHKSFYSEIPNRAADRNKQATLVAYLLSKSINMQGGIFCLLHEKLRVGWKENLKNLSEHALLLGRVGAHTSVSAASIRPCPKV